MRCVAIVLLVAIVSTASGFGVAPTRFATRFSRSSPRLFSEDPSKNTDLVPLDKKNIENAAAVTGGIVGFALGGPVIALILAAISNYVSKKDSDAGTALRGFGKSVIESFNFVTTLNKKYDVTGTVSSSVSKAVSSAEGESEGFEKVSKTVNSTFTKIKEINAEFDLVGKGKLAAIAAAELSDAALKKVEELNAQVLTNIDFASQHQLATYLLQNHMHQINYKTDRIKQINYYLLLYHVLIIHLSFLSVRFCRDHEKGSVISS